jgi:hypothetical protein
MVQVAVNLDVTTKDALSLTDKAMSVAELVSIFVNEGGFFPMIDNDVDVCSNNEVCYASTNQELEDRWVISTKGEPTIMEGGVNDMLSLLPLVFCAGAIRYTHPLSGLGIIEVGDDGRLYAAPIDHEMYGFLGTALRCHPVPMPVRTYDPMPLLLRGCAIQVRVLDSGSCERRGVGQDENWLNTSLQLVDMVFRAIIIRLTGRVGRFSSYWRYSSSKSHITSWVPSREEFPVFSQFMLSTKKMSCWTSRQHFNSLPKDVVSSVDAFIRYMKIIATNVERTVEEMVAVNSLSKAASILKKMMEGTVCQLSSQPGVKDLSFLVQEIIADINEIYMNPFGEQSVDGTSIILGHGALTALRILKGREGGNDNTWWLRKIYDSFSTHSKGEQGKEFLKTLGLCITGRGSVVTRLNGRLVDMKDVEHFLCKVYIMVYKTIGDRSVTLRPLATTPWCHPLRLRSQCAWDSDRVFCIFEESIQAAQRLVEKEKLVLPSVFRLRGEEVYGEELSVSSSE